MSKSFAETFQVSNAKSFKLADCDPRDKCGLEDKDKVKAKTAEDSVKIDALQNCLYAEGKRSLLVILQGIDCSGKDGTVKAVFNSSGPIGVQIASFKAPVGEELAHDYLWRIHKVVPAKGYIGVFNRSHYEEPV
jgi:polyphosphate kinase 2 (PPK2 family)